MRHILISLSADQILDTLNSSSFEKYRTPAITNRGLYTFYPLFEIQKRFSRVFFLNSGPMYG